MSQLNQGQLIVLSNQKVYDNQEDIKPDGHYGELGYPGIFKGIKFRILDFKEHNYHGRMARCEILDPRAQGEVFLRVEDCVPAVTKITINYTVLDKSKKLSDIASKIMSLISERQAAISSGKYKKTGRKLTGITKEMEALRAEQDKITSTHFVLLHRTRQVVEVADDIFQDTSKSQEFLANKVREFRKENKKFTTVSKEAFGSKFTMMGGVHTQPETYGKIFETIQLGIVRSKKLPKDANAKYLGIEIECLMRKNKDEFEKLLIKNRLQQYVQVVEDGSITNCMDGYNDWELRILVPEHELEPVLTRLHKLLKSREVDAYVNRSCGLHVHLDMRNRSVQESYKRLFNVQSLLLDSQPVSRSLSRYCKPNTDITFIGHTSSKERYRVINPVAFRKQQTLEVRVHEGTVNCLDIIKWCKFLTAVVECESITAPVTSTQQLQSFIEPTALQYIERRIEEFAA